MKLSHVFTSKTARFEKAIEQNDIEAMKELMPRMSGFDFYLEITNLAATQGATPEMTAVLMAGMDKDGHKSKDNKLSLDTKNNIKSLYFSTALERGDTKSADAVLASAIDFSKLKANVHPAHRLLNLDKSAVLTPEQRMTYLRRILSDGTDNLQGHYPLVLTAASSNYIDGVRLLANIGFDVRADGEAALRQAAQKGHKDMCRYLIDEHSADATKAIAACEALDKNSPAAKFLHDITNGQFATPKTPTPLEAMQAEMETLRATVRELTATIEDMRAPQKDLGKKPMGKNAPSIGIRK